MNIENKKILITGVAGFIGAALAKELLKMGANIIGIDNLNNYYSRDLKLARLQEINKLCFNKSHKWNFYEMSIEDNEVLKNIFKKENPHIVVNLAAYAGVRYSLINPSAYIKTNLEGFGNILENCRIFKVENLVYASSSSVYGGNISLPYKENQQVNHPVSLYAATKKANELLAHSYSHNFNLSTTGLRFFTVYGPWGRPDMAPMIFADSIINDKPIKVNNYGKMSRDFTYIDDIVEGVIRCCLKPAVENKKFDYINPDPATSKSPYRIFNIGNNRNIELLKFIEIIEDILGKKAKKILSPLPKGDVISTKADMTTLNNWINFTPKTKIEDGMNKFISWFKNYYKY